MNTNQYAPKQIYDNINSILEDFKLQSDMLHKSIQGLEVKCENYQFISENEIDNIIDIIRNYTLVKESCLEQSKKILEVDNIQSLKELESQVKEHQNHSVAVTDEILYYAYEFLKIRSSNVITDGLLQDHREKLNAIINSVLNEFINIEEVSKQLEPYKIALLYITKQISDLTQYAELINQTFGAILFYNIVSGNNLDYDTNNMEYDILNLPNIVNQTIDENEIFDFMEFTIENVNVDEFDTQANQEVITEESNEVFDDTEVTSDLQFEEPITNDSAQLDTPLIDATNESQQLEIPEVNEITKVNPTEEYDTENPQIEDTTDVESQTPPTETQPIDELENVQIDSTDDTTEYDSNVEIEEDEIDDYFESLTNSIDYKYNETDILDSMPIEFDENQILNHFCDYVLSEQFSCASMVLKEHSKLSNNIETLYNQYGLSVNDPCINSDYSEAFVSIVNYDVHTWLELSAILRAMFNSKNKSIECYSFNSYINSVVQNMNENILKYIPNLFEILDIFDSIEYNTNYMTGIKLFDESNTITSKIIKQAKEMMEYCENTVRLWNHKAMTNATKSLFSSSGGYLYNIIKEISLGNFSNIDTVKEYCNRFSNDDGHMLEGIYLDRSIEEYLHEQLNIANKRSNYNGCDTDINIGYKNKFTTRFTNILKFLFSYIERMEAFSINCINSTNVEKYRVLKDRLVEMFNNNYNELYKKSNSLDVPQFDAVGMKCLAKTFSDLVSYIDYETYNQNYFYCELLKTDYFMLNEFYLPYSNENISNISGLEISTRVNKHINDLKYINSWEDAIENNIKKLNFGNVKLIISYLKDTNQSIDDNKLQSYLNTIDNNNYSLEDSFNKFTLKIKELYLTEVIPNKSILNRVFYLENIVKDIVLENRNYGFYNMFLETLEDYIIKVSEEAYSSKNNILDLIGKNLGYDSQYYKSIAENVDNHCYCVADELISMYFNSFDFPQNDFNNSQTEQYNNIFSQFIEFNLEYAPKLRAWDYVFMNEVYHNTIESIVLERLGRDYDYEQSCDLIKLWVKGQDEKNVIYDILTNIGFGIDKNTSEEVGTHAYKLSLYNSEKNDTQPYSIPEYAIFLNGKLYNSDKAKRSVSNLKITQNTLIILDYSISISDRDEFLSIINEISNGNKVVLIDRCAIMFLITQPISVRKLTFKLCSICSTFNDSSCSSNFRTDYIQTFTKEKRYNLLLGREYFGKTFIINSVAESLKSNADNIVLLIDAFENDFSTPELISQECENLKLKINPFEDWNTFESSMTRYLNKHPNKKVILLVDNAETYIQECINNKLEVSSIMILKNLSIKFKDRFTFTMAVDINDKYIRYANEMDLTYSILNPLTYSETALMFQSYLNGSRISIEDSEVMSVLVSKTFGCPEMVRLISKQIATTINNEKNLFSENYLYSLTMEMVNKALSNDDFINIIVQVFLSTVIGNDEGNSMILPVVYAIVYFLDEHSNTITFTINDIINVLNIFDIEESDILNVQTVLDELCTLRLICKLNDNEYFFSHEVYRNYLGNKEFAFDMLDHCTKIFTKEGITS